MILPVNLGQDSYDITLECAEMRRGSVRIEKRRPQGDDCDG